MQFEKYNSIENSYDEKFVQSIFMQGLADVDYIVQEKVHGANFSFITNGKEVLTAKRTGLILENENFYNSNIVKRRYEEKVINLFDEISRTVDLKSLIIFGEIFGGGYPHPEVKVEKEISLIQHGIYYHSHIDFYAFDLLINGKTFLEVPKTNQLFEKHGFIYAKTLYKGNLKECLNYPNNFKTTLPKMIGLPELNGNVCEGVVIRPIKSLFLTSGSRVLIKNKNEKWRENNRHIDDHLIKKIMKEEWSENVQFLCKEILKFISENRLNNVLSKIGEVHSKKHYGKILGLFNKDILEDFLKIHEEMYNELEKNEQKEINKLMNQQAGNLIGNYFINIKE